MPVLSAGATYAIGKAFIEHFTSGGTLLDFDPPDYREFVRAQKEMWDSRSKESARTRGAAEHAENAGQQPAPERRGLCVPGVASSALGTVN